ncbi:MAG TPA: phosphoribosylglycinamide formyltransferase [Fimbriimonas sp.]|nr:phosphoribosylglycinamide formyltransferase [Fimbriimonas sp.]
MALNVSIIIGTKGRGSNMVALSNQIAQDDRFVVHSVIGTKAEAPALAVANEMGLNTKVVPVSESYERDLEEALAGVDYICLAGYMRLLPAGIVHKWDHRILNIHPALLPKFGGKGMYGSHVHEAVLEARETESGCSVHYVTEQYDEGAIIHQMRCPVLPDDTPETLAARVLKLEHQCYYDALVKVAFGG